MIMYGTHLNHSTFAPEVGGSEKVSGGGRTHLDMENDIYAAAQRIEQPAQQPQPQRWTQPVQQQQPAQGGIDTSFLDDLL